uniref:Uncharacterized protein n=1 Tax=Plectus sambesii TaxID=2011161 RepID=A0A914VW18_9BILA
MPKNPAKAERKKEPMRFGPGANDMGPEELEHMITHIRRYSPLWRLRFGDPGKPSTPGGRWGGTVAIMVAVFAVYVVLTILLWKALTVNVNPKGAR